MTARVFWRWAFGRGVLALVAGALASVSASAQGTAPVTWEFLGHPEPEYRGRMVSLAFTHGSAPDGSLDTLYVGTQVLFRRPPGGPFSGELHVVANLSQNLVATPAGTLLVGDSHLDRSTNGGRTWMRVLDGYGVSSLHQSTDPAFEGALYACLATNAFSIWTSEEDGAPGTWTQRGAVGGGAETIALQEVVASAALPGGRLLAGAWNGAAYSDDGGDTWTLSSLWRPGHYVVRRLAFVPDPTHPFGGVAYAGMRDFGLGRLAVYRSDDGGATWDLSLAISDGDYGIPEPFWLEMVTGPDGSVWVGIDESRGPFAGRGTFVRSVDGGQTWQEVADGYDGWAVTAMIFGRDGRLYAGTASNVFAPYVTSGLWRTVDPVAVAREPVPSPTSQALRPAVHPNPTTGVATLTFTLAEPAAARVTLLDAAGRRIATIQDGRLPAGAHQFPIDTASLGAGTYLVHVATDQAVATVPLVRP